MLANLFVRRQINHSTFIVSTISLLFIVNLLIIDGVQARYDRHHYEPIPEKRLRKADQLPEYPRGRRQVAPSDTPAENVAATLSTVSTTLRPDTSSSTPQSVDPSVLRKPAGAPPSKTSSLLPPNPSVHYDARDITYFLESHPAHSIHDPRAYLTEERTTRSLAIMLNEMGRLPRKLRFAYVVRVYSELGRKIASKLNYYASEVAAILRKAPDDLGNKPEVSMLVDTVHNAFASKEDRDPKEETDSMMTMENPLSSLIKQDKEKAAVFNSSLVEISTRLAHFMSYFAVMACKNAIPVPPNARKPMADLLAEAMQMGAKAMVTEMSKGDKFRVPEEIVNYMDKIFNMTTAVFKRHVRESDERVGDLVTSNYNMAGQQTFKDLNPISDKTGLIGAWNSHLFTNLGSSERVIKLFASLMSRVPPEAKSKWYNMYVSQVYLELERTLSGFVLMQGMPYNNNASGHFLLNPALSVALMPMKAAKPRMNYIDDKNRIPARCYLAGRRWRMVLTRALKKYDSRDAILKGLADKIGELKVSLVKKSGNEIYRLCMPRLEVGLRGWGINGDPQADGGVAVKFPLRNPIEDLNRMDDPFVSGVKMGYKLGVKVGYNEERNATLEMESAGSKESGDAETKAKVEIKFLSRAAFRRASTVGAKRALEIAAREGYMTSLKLSIRAGMQIPSEAGSRLSALRCVSVAGQAGKEAGRSVADAYTVHKEMTEELRKSYMNVGEAHGLWAGELMGDTIGAIVGKEAAEEAYKRAIIRGGKVERAKFHLEEYEAGAALGFDLGLKEGKRIASSSTLDPSAPRFFRLPKPVFSESDKADVEVDHWEKDLIPPLSDSAIAELSIQRDHTTVSGSLKGLYKVARETKKGLKRVAYANSTYNLEVFAKGFIMNNVAYLTLNGTVNKVGLLRGSLIARDIFNEDKD